MTPEFASYASRYTTLVRTTQGVPRFPPDLAAAVEGDAISGRRPYTLAISLSGDENKYTVSYIERRVGPTASLYVATRRNIDDGHPMTLWLARTLVKYAKLCGRSVCYNSCSEENVVSFLVNRNDARVTFFACRDGQRFPLHEGTVMLPGEV